jgi:hypothetical protein
MPFSVAADALFIWKSYGLHALIIKPLLCDKSELNRANKKPASPKIAFFKQWRNGLPSFEEGVAINPISS